MLHKNKFNATAFSVLVLMFCAIFSMYIGCSSDSPTTTTPPADANVVRFDNLDITPATLNGIDLYIGKNIGSNAGKDIAVISGGINGPPYYFQSGDISGGSKTGFTLVDSTISQSGYESISSVSAWGSAGASIVDTVDFLSHSNTMSWGTINNPATINPVYGFYLQGKYANGTTSAKVFGLIYINSVSGGGATIIKINISVRFNKVGLNKF